MQKRFWLSKLFNFLIFSCSTRTLMSKWSKAQLADPIMSHHHTKTDHTVRNFVSLIKVGLFSKKHSIMQKFVKWFWISYKTTFYLTNQPKTTLVLSVYLIYISFILQLMETNVKDVYAAGDVVEFPLFNLEDKIVNIQHYQMAHTQGKNQSKLIYIIILHLIYPPPFRERKGY